MKSPSPKNQFLLIACLAAGSSLLGACVSSEETGSGGSKATEPQRTLSPIDTTRIQREASVSQTAGTKRSNRGGAKFLARSDTVEASLTKKPKVNPRPIVRPDNPAYTVQIGAFGRAQNALRMQKTAKERLGNRIVLNNYDASDKLYRVSVGKFDARTDASSLRRELIEKYPKDYGQCWVNYIVK